MDIQVVTYNYVFQLDRQAEKVTVEYRPLRPEEHIDPNPSCYQLDAETANHPDVREVLRTPPCSQINMLSATGVRLIHSGFSHAPPVRVLIFPPFQIELLFESRLEAERAKIWQRCRGGPAHAISQVNLKEAWGRIFK